MTSSTRPTVTLQNPGDLLAAVPHVLGFHPTDSLVVLGLRGAHPGTLGLTLRVDLPPLAHAAALADGMVIPLAEHRTDRVAMIVIGGLDPGQLAGLPHRDLLGAFASAFADADMPVIHKLWASNTDGGGRWCCYDESDCGGVVPDPRTTPLADFAAEAGAVTYRRREDIVATLTPEPEDVLDRRASLLAAVSAATEPGRANGETVAAKGKRAADDDLEMDEWASGEYLTADDHRTAERFAVVTDAIESVRAGPPILTDEDVLRLADALGDRRVRDLCLDFEAMPEPSATEQLWTALTRATPPPERAAPAALLAFSAYARGDGVLAGIALDVASRADPGHRLAELLRNALVIGIPPRRMREAGIFSARRASLGLDVEWSR